MALVAPSDGGGAPLARPNLPYYQTLLLHHRNSTQCPKHCHYCAASDYCMSVVCALGSHTVHQLLDTRFCFSSNRRLSRVRTCSFSVPHWRQSEGRSLTIPSQGLPARDSLREHSQLRRGGYLLQSNGRKRLDSHIQNARRSDRKDR